MAKINDLPLLSNPTEDMYCLVGKEDLQKVPCLRLWGRLEHLILQLLSQV